LTRAPEGFIATDEVLELEYCGSHFFLCLNIEKMGLRRF